jgi:hypothetical protein
MVVKQPSSVPHLKQARLSLRLHRNLESALEFLATGDQRKLASYVELILRDHVAALLSNAVLPDGRVQPSNDFRLRTPGRYR